ncbi:FGGY-family carbohydrate kinase [Flavobacteriaceae bacterium M23B6Z8]
MSGIPVTAIFDIGKTNKKFFLFDKDLKEVHREYISFHEIKDEDGFPTENLSALLTWIHQVLKRIFENKEFEIKTLNFSTYGASLVHLGKDGSVLTPLYNYLKPMPQDILQKFAELHGDPQKIASDTASPPDGFLNAGMQLFWLKYKKPEIFTNLECSLHFPQYLSYVFTGKPISEYTSIGCHTSLWDYSKKHYHPWVIKEGLDKFLAPIVPSSTTFDTVFNEYKIKVGTGIHDSSAALIPYILANKKPFLLVSTGTWSVSLNPFCVDFDSDKQQDNDHLNYMQPDGKAVRATRFFMGKEYQVQTELLTQYFKVAANYHKTIAFDPCIYHKIQQLNAPVFHFSNILINRKQPEKTNLGTFSSFEEAYHCLLLELVKLQTEVIEAAIGNTPIKKIFIDGGFTDNDIFVKLIAHHFSDYKVRTTTSSLGSALGAAMVVNEKPKGKKLLRKHYQMKKMISKLPE